MKLNHFWKNYRLERSKELRLIGYDAASARAAANREALAKSIVEDIVGRQAALASELVVGQKLDGRYALFARIDPNLTQRDLSSICWSGFTKGPSGQNLH